MKKKLLLILFLTLIIFTSNFILVFAEDKKLDWNKYLSVATIGKDGSLTISEKDTFKFSGSFNGLNRDIDIDKASLIEKIQVSEDMNGQIVNYELVNSAKNGDSNVYTVEKLNNTTYRLKIYKPSNDQTRTFNISYVLKDVATKYNDTGELYWKFIGEDNISPIKSASITIKLPQGSKRDDIKIFGHGPLEGYSSILDDNTVELSASPLPSETFIEARVLFPASLIPNSKNIVQEDKLQDILNEEEQWANEANAKREAARRKINMVRIFSIVVFIFTIILSIYLHIKYNKEVKPSFSQSFYRELPDDCTPAVASALINFGKISSKDITATIMDLVRKRYLFIEQKQSEVKKLFGTKTKTDYVLVKIKENDSFLKEHEVFLIEWLINTMGDGNSISFDTIEQYAKSKTNAISFKKDYDKWCSLVQIEAERKNYFDKKADVGKAIGVLVGVAEIICGIFLIISDLGLSPMLIIIIGIFLLIFSITFNKRTKYGAEQFAMWKAFKHFLKEFSNLKEATIPSLILWEHYLVYAISLGVAREVINQLKIVIREEDYHTNGLTYLYAYNYAAGARVFDQLDFISSSFEHSASTAISLASSQNSSSSGGGGGFSGGGGGGGGGGGASGF